MSEFLVERLITSRGRVIPDFHSFLLFIFIILRVKLDRFCFTLELRLEWIR